MRRSLFILLTIGCGGGGTAAPPSITAINPAFGPLSGGTRVIITGQGFLADGAPPDRVVFGDSEAPLAAATDDTTLEVEVPPGTKAGDVPIVVFNQNGSTTAMGIFHYSTVPTITTVTPTEVVFSATTTTVTISGTGFKDESAGVVGVTLDGMPAVDVNVTSDTQLTITAVAGLPMVKPVIEVTNNRGVASSTGFRYVPSMNPGLILFTHGVPGSGAQQDTTMAVYYDPVNNVQVQFPQRGNTTAHVKATFIDANGDMWAVVGPRRSGGSSATLGKLDFHTGATVESPVPVTSSPAALALIGTTLFTYDRQTGSVGKVDMVNGTFTKLAAQNNSCCQSLFVHNSMLFYSEGSNVLATLDQATGAESAPITLNPAKQFVEMRFLGNTLFGADRSGNIFTINQSTGAVSAAIHSVNVGVSAMEVFQP